MQPWIDNVSSVMMAWYLGNECGNAIADVRKSSFHSPRPTVFTSLVVFGKVNPSGKLPLTLPRRIEDTPSFAAFGK